MFKPVYGSLVGALAAAVLVMAPFAAQSQTVKRPTTGQPQTVAAQPGPKTVAGAATKPAAKLAPRNQKLATAKRNAPANINPTDKYAALIIDADSGAALYSVNADETRHPASLTKVMTLYLTFEALKAGKLKMEQMLRTSAWASIQSPTKLGLKDGSQISVHDAVLGLITKSANDAAVVLAEALAGDEDVFAQRMTEKARLLGMTGTVFRNASGLPNDQQVTTARDMAILAQAIMRDFPMYYHLFSTQEFTWAGRIQTNHNRMLGWYPGADGLKTGYTVASGFNLIMSARREGKRLIGVVLGGESAQARDNHMAELMDRSFGQTLTASIGQPIPATVQANNPVNTRTNLATANIPRPAAGQPVRWAIQVGAFSDTTAARNAVNLAMTYLPELQNANPGVAPLANRGRTLYRARIAGISEQQANAGCRKLEMNNIISCQVIRIEPGEIDVAAN